MPFVSSFAVLKGLLIVPVGAMGSFWPGVNTFKGGGGVGCVQGRELDVRTLSSGVYPGGEDIVYDCHL